MPTCQSGQRFVDELAAAAGREPVAFRKALLAQRPKECAVLELAADKAEWGQPLAPAPDGAKRGRAIAVYRSSGSALAQVAEVTVHADKTFRVDRVVCAIECALAVNPDGVRAQMDGGIGFGLSAALHGAITIRNGAPEQSNFNDYRVLRIDEMPAIAVHIGASTDKPTGAGQEGVPGIAPAVANALAAATGKRVRKLPLALA
jgi:isoquinoline 1-oxidoreductase beta subunit